MTFQFSGHETFICKQFWLKKGYDYIVSKKNFADEAALISLGVGKNMVTSINYWLKAFGICDNNNQITPIGDYIFNDKLGKDPYLENLGTLWLLHYYLVKTNKASLYNIYFNFFRRGKTEFTKDQLLNYTIRKIENEEGSKVNLNTINADMSVFIRSYLRPEYKLGRGDVEDDFSALLLDLELMKSYQAENAERKAVEWYQIENTNRPDLPYQIVLYSILDNEYFGNSIPFKELLIAPNSPGAVFSLSENGLFKKIEEIINKHTNIVYTETAGVRELQLKGNLSKGQFKKDILNEYYEN